jgi:uncharacterized membrane protein YczE
LDRGEHKVAESRALFTRAVNAARAEMAKLAVAIAAIDFSQAGLSITVLQGHLTTARSHCELAAHPLVGVSVALLIRSDLGAAPWDVFHVALADATGLSVGVASNVTAVVAITVALIAGVRPGLGTLVNALLIGVCVDAALFVVPVARSLVAGGVYLATGVVALGLGTGLYLSAELGSGPRDSLMVALARRRRWTTARARVVVELTALTAGVLLGGRLGAGTLLYAVAIGPVAQWGIHVFQKDPA